MTPVIARIIPAGQNCLPGRALHTSLGIIRDVIYTRKANRNPLYVLSLDQNKAFDRVSHKFLFHLLDVIGLPSYIVRAIGALYRGYICFIKNVDRLSAPIPYKRGVRQGDPMSTILYALAIQPVLNIILVTQPYGGQLLSNGKRILMTAFADDLTVFLESMKDVEQVVKAVQYIGGYSQAKLNLEKSVIMPFNHDGYKYNEDVTDSCIPVNIDKITILGVTFTQSMKIHNSQWDKKIQEARDRIAQATNWLKSRSYKERAQWAASKIWPRWIHIIKTLQPSAVQIRQMEVVLSEAIWIGGKHWIGPEQLAAPVECGGLLLVNPQDKIDILRVMTMSRVINQGTEEPAFQLAENILNGYAGARMGFRVFQTKPDKVAMKVLPQFYQAVLTAWDKFPIGCPIMSEELMMKTPCFNSRFLLQQEPPVEITISQATSYGAYTLGQLLSANHINTRSFAISKVRIKDALKEWKEQNLLEQQQIPGGHQTTRKERKSGDSICKIDIRKPNYVMIFETGLIPMDNWTNKILLKDRQEMRRTEDDNGVPKETWKILASSQISNTQRNQFWRFLHKKIPTPEFYSQIGVKQNLECVLCKAEDCSYVHQFLTCRMLKEALEALSEDVSVIGLPPLLNQNQLYSDKTTEAKLANMLVVAFIYMVILVTKCVANGGGQPTSRTIKNMYYNTIAKHVVCYARENPPNIKDGKFRWMVMIHEGIVAKIEQDILFVRTAKGFRQYSTKMLKLE